MQTDLEATFGQLLSGIVSSIQDAAAPIQTRVEECESERRVRRRMQTKMAQRAELASHLENAERAISTFYQCLEGRE